MNASNEAKAVKRAEAREQAERQKRYNERQHANAPWPAKAEATAPIC